MLYLDRVCIGQAMTSIQEDRGFGELEATYVFLSFQVAYGLFEYWTGRWGDRIGSRAVLTRIAVWWSAFTALTAACTGLWSLLAARFLFGVGEAGALPNVARIIARWFPPAERKRVGGYVQTAMLVGAAATPAVAAYAIEWLGWRWAFVLFGATGVVWAALFWRWFRDDPAEHPSVNTAELALLGPAPALAPHEPVPWRAVLRSRSIWLLAGIMTFSAFNSYFYFSWFPTYLQKGRGLGKVEAGHLASLALTGAVVGMFLSGFAADAFAWCGWPLAVARRVFGAAAFSAAALTLYLGTRQESPLAMTAYLAASYLLSTSTLATWWATVGAVSGRHLGALFGLVNGVGTVGALSSQYFFGWFPVYREKLGYVGRERWDPAFTMSMAVLLLAAACWASYASRPVQREG